MAACTEATHHGIPLDVHCNGKEKGILGDSSRLVCNNENGDGVLGGSPLPTTAPLFSGSLELVDLAKTDPVSFCSPETSYIPVLRSGSWADIGSRSDMEDEHVTIDDLGEQLGTVNIGKGPGAYYGVFDGHGGKEAAHFVKERLLKFVLEDVAFPSAVEDALKRAFLQTDVAFAEAYSSDLSGTTAITVFIFGRKLLVANAGDCRAVLCRRGKAVEMSRDHKPDCIFERVRIESLGGFVDDGYLNGELSVSRALGDWHMKDLKGINGPLSAEPEVQKILLSEEDEFFIIASDGLWDVFTSQSATDFARRKLQQHNDPEQCSQELVAEALRRDTRDNLTVVTVCLQTDPPPRLASKFFVRSMLFGKSLRGVQDVLNGGSD